jgi:hypothetical protein
VTIIKEFKNRSANRSRDEITTRQKNPNDDNKKTHSIAAYAFFGCFVFRFHYIAVFSLLVFLIYACLSVSLLLIVSIVGLTINYIQVYFYVYCNKCDIF